MSGADPFEGLSDQVVLDLYLTGFTAGAATVYDSTGIARGAAAMQSAQTLGHRIAKDPVLRESILTSVRKPATPIRRGPAARFTTLRVLNEGQPDRGERS